MSIVLELPEELAARIAAHPGGKQEAIAVLEEYFFSEAELDTEAESLDEDTIAHIRVGLVQVDRGETVSIEEGQSYLKQYLDDRFGN